MHNTAPRDSLEMERNEKLRAQNTERLLVVMVYLEARTLAPLTSQHRGTARHGQMFHTYKIIR